MSKKTKYLWYTAAIGCLVLFLLILLSSILDVGVRLREISVYLEYLFYVLVAGLVFIAVINPVRIILQSPSIGNGNMDPTDKKVIKTYKKVAKNIVKANELPEEQIALLTNYKDDAELLINLQYVFEQSIKSKLNKIIIQEAKTVMISTAISQSARLDLVSSFAINVRMIKKLVVKCGFRPTTKNLSKLTINVMGTALIAEGLENLSLDEIIPQNASNAISSIPFVKPLVESLLQGVANALMSIRIGVITRKYLFTDGKAITKEEIRKEALKESAKLIPLVVADTVAFFPKKVVKFFSKGKNEEENLEN